MHAVQFSSVYIVKVHYKCKYGSAGITEQILCTSENLERLKHIRQKYKESDVVQENAYNIALKCFYLKSK